MTLISARRVPNLIPLSDTTPEYTQVKCISILFPPATCLVLYLSSCVTSNIRCTSKLFEPYVSLIFFLSILRHNIYQYVLNQLHPSIYYLYILII